jgi:hypothetical protein
MLSDSAEESEFERSESAPLGGAIAEEAWFSTTRKMTACIHWLAYTVSKNTYKLEAENSQLILFFSHVQHNADSYIFCIILGFVRKPRY